MVFGGVTSVEFYSCVDGQLLLSYPTGYHVHSLATSACGSLTVAGCEDGHVYGFGGELVTVRPDGAGIYPTIQAAINAVLNGYVIELDEGTFTGSANRNLDFKGNAITVRSACGDPGRCRIDCSTIEPTFLSRGFYFHHGEGSNSKVQGVTITNGFVNSYPGGGGAIRCNGASPTIEDCIIAGNEAPDGGGIYCDNASPTIIGCVITGNKAETNGGGVYGSANIESCTISGNWALSQGGGIFGACTPRYTIMSTPF